MADEKETIKMSNGWLENISDEEKAAIETGLKQLDSGEGIQQEKAVKQLKWFPKSSA